MLTNSSYNSHTKPLFEKLKILPFDDILYEQKMIFMHSVYNNYALVSFSNVWTKNIEREQQYKLRNENNYVLPRPRFEVLKNTLYILLPKHGMNPGTLDFIVIPQHSK